MELKGRGSSTAQRNAETRWLPPSGEHVKINIDGAISTQGSVYGMGAVARNNSGEVVAAMACKGHGAVCAEIAEACSLRKALNWAHGLSLEKIIMESDCASIVTALNSDISGMNSSLGTVLQDCKLLMGSFIVCRVQYIRKEGNSVAHELARRALHAEDDEYWLEEVPDNVAHIVTSERLSL